MVRPLRLLVHPDARHGIHLFPDTGNVAAAPTCSPSKKRYAPRAADPRTDRPTDRQPMASQMTSRTHLKRKEVDDVMGGEAAWENVDKVPGTSPTKPSRSVLIHGDQPCVRNVITGKRITGSYKSGGESSSRLRGLRGYKALIRSWAWGGSADEPMTTF